MSLSNTNDNGFIYCFSNQSMPNIYKIGITDRTPIDRLKEANVGNTWKPPTPYKLEFAKKIKNNTEIENILFKIFQLNGNRINPKKEFVKCEIQFIKLLFDLIDGSYWDQKNIDNSETTEEIELSSTQESLININQNNNLSLININQDEILPPINSQPSLITQPHQPSTVKPRPPSTNRPHPPHERPKRSRINN